MKINVVLVFVGMYGMFARQYRGVTRDDATMWRSPNSQRDYADRWPTTLQTVCTSNNLVQHKMLNFAERDALMKFYLTSELSDDFLFFAAGSSPSSLKSSEALDGSTV